MKRFFVFLFVIIFCFGLCSCKKSEISFYMPDGAPALAFSKLINDSDNLSFSKVNYNVVSANEISSYMKTGEGDMVLLPLNNATINYDIKDDIYQMISVITHGNLYLVANTQFDLEDLKGKVVGVMQEGQIPDLTFKAVLKDNDIDYERVEGFSASPDVVGIRYLGAPEIKQALKQGNIFCGLLPEPAVSVGQTANMQRLKLHELYDGTNKAYPQAVLMIKKSILDSNPKLIDKIKLAFSDSLSWIKSNTVDAVNAVKTIYPSTSLSAETMTSKVIDNCNIYWQDSETAKKSVNDYIQRVMGVSDLGLGIVSVKAVGENFFR